MTGAPPSMGSPTPLRIAAEHVAGDVELGDLAEEADAGLVDVEPCVPSKTWMTAVSPETSRTWPVRSRAVRHHDLDHLVERGPLDVLDEDQRARHVLTGSGIRSRAASRV